MLLDTRPLAVHMVIPIQPRNTSGLRAVPASQYASTVKESDLSLTLSGLILVKVTTASTSGVTGLGPSGK